MLRAIAMRFAAAPTSGVPADFRERAYGGQSVCHGIDKPAAPRFVSRQCFALRPRAGAGILAAAMLSFLLAVLPFAIVTSITPGPNNIMVTASAANFGYRRTVPHMLGVSFGFPVMLILLGVGTGQVFAAYPLLHQVLKFAGAAYLLYLAWRLARASRGEGGGGAAKPLNFLQAALFQWINGKAWFIAAGAITAYTTVGGDMLAEISLIAAVFVAVCYPALTIWALFGLAIGRLLKSDRALAAFNWTMAALLVLSLVPVFF
jgi:threonine/homoserine/homoserine lactone efflux protein